ncbi:hypothetical protein [Nocardia gipuzkoensis]|uniref:hypothetical protein n=1 Tax=Nocardia gipuzkoensis TaxID=2749991 RepID=UPI00245396D0|nr:hypothetical protein [Nocardia gipuzkoensis]
MSGTAEPVRPPKSYAEWARDADNRLKSLENPTSQRIGPWVRRAAPPGPPPPPPPPAPVCRFVVSADNYSSGLMSAAASGP